MNDGLLDEITGRADRSIEHLADELLDATEAELIAALREMRARDGRSIRALSAATGIPASTLGGFFSGRHIPVYEDTWRRLLGGLGVRDAVVVEGTVEETLGEEELEERFGSGWTDVMQEEHSNRPWIEAATVEVPAG